MPSPTTRTIDDAAALMVALATLPTATPGLEELAAELGRPARLVAAQIKRMERRDLVESWPDPGRFGSLRVTLSGRSASRLGLRLSPEGDGWEAAGNPDRPRRRGR